MPKRVFFKPPPDWKTLPQEEKDAYVEVAAKAIEEGLLQEAPPAAPAQEAKP